MAGELEFRPAAVEIQDTPPSPIGRAILLTILLAFSAALVWASIGRLDIVAVALGRVIPSGYSKAIQSPGMGTVKRIHVAEGQHVQPGELLVELDPEIAAAEVARLEQQTAARETETRRLQLLLQRLREAPNATWQTGIKQLPTAQRRLLQAQWQSHRVRLEGLQHTQRGQQSGQAGAVHQTEKLQAILPIVTRRAEKLKKLAGQKYLATEQFLEIEQQRLETRHNLAAQLSRAEELTAAVAETASKIKHATWEFERQLLEELVAAEKRQSELIQELIKARKRAAQQSLHAPISGVVQQLAIHTPGGVVKPAQRLMVLVPDNGLLEVEVQVENKDIGFVSVGQSAEIKFDAFPFTRYGVIEGQVTDLAREAVTDQRLGLVYPARVRLAQPAIRVDGRPVALSPGMKAAVEIKTGKRRLIEYFLSPLLRYRHESIRER